MVFYRIYFLKSTWNQIYNIYLLAHIASLKVNN